MVASNNSIDNTVGATISGVTNTMTVQNPSNTASSAAQALITVGGTTSGSPWMQWTVGSTRSWALGQNNSDSQKLYLNYASAATVSPTTGTNMLFFDHTAPGMTLGAAHFVVFNTSALAQGTLANNGVNIYEVGTFQPTLIGGTSAGTTTYTTQLGAYIRYDNLVDLKANIVITAATGTGDARAGNLPFTINNSAHVPFGAIQVSGSGWTWPASRTQETLNGFTNDTFSLLNAIGSAVTGSNTQMANAALTLRYSFVYRI